ncbi:DUF418 domain-containing protein [Pseudonocardia aurantiaca]|uniref:DUF418 domain-containing protein n=1 Tax=Pseudonocardia aurantiaca TaxID=75290 RepID=A0ABW4FV40_9PSEU
MSAAETAAETSPARSRIASLDVLRGIAILGTFASNAWLFAVPGGALVWFAGGLGPQDPVEAGLRLLSNGKFLALLTLLFGVGLELQYRAAVRRGNPWPGRYPLRALILFAEGLVHYLLVFEFDVLMGYAITSVLVAYLVGRSDSAVRLWMRTVGAIFVGMVLVLTALLVLTPDGPAQPLAVDPAATASWTAQVADRVQYFLLFRIEIVLIVPSATVLFLVGSRLLRAGAFADTEVGAGIRKRLMIIGLGVAFPLNVLTTFGGADWFLVDRYLLPPLVALGLLGLVTSIVVRSRRELGPMRRGLAAVGRTALSCYVLQNVLAGALCYGWGLGLAARFADARPWWVLGLWAGVCAVLVVAASLWLRRFDRGPLELVMHRLYAPRRASVAAEKG